MNYSKEKLNQLEFLANEHSAFLIVITESWLNECLLDAEVKINGFYLLRSDRSTKGRGGTCVYTKSGISAISSLSYSNNSVEAIVIKLKELKTVVFSIYRPPGSNFEDFAEVLDMVEQEVSFV